MKNAAMQRPKVVTITYAQGDMHQLHAQRQQMHLGGELADQLSGFEWVGTHNLIWTYHWSIQTF